MRDHGFLSADAAAAVRPARLRVDRIALLPNGSYFADWVLPAARDRTGAITTEQRVMTTLDARLQRAAEGAVRRAGLKKAQVAIVAMRPDGRVVAMVGGKSYGDSPFNRATQARRQAGSAFKLFVYLAALRAGMTPDSIVSDEPVTIANWAPKNNDGRYLGNITLREAFARSSNVVAARLTQQHGVAQVIRAARDLGISTPIPDEATIALGTANTSLLELTAAYAAIAAGSYPVRPHGLDEVGERSWLEYLGTRSRRLSGTTQAQLMDLLSASINDGTGRQAALAIDSFGKTGTSQDNRDALFIGFARNLVVGVWVGNDDNSPNAGLSGGGVPARIWRDFMGSALGVGAKERPPVITEPEPAELPDAVEGVIDNSLDGIEGELSGFGLNLKIGRDGTIDLKPAPGDRPRNRRRPDDRIPPDEEPQ